MATAAERVAAYLDKFEDNPQNGPKVHTIERMDGTYILTVADLRELVETSDAVDAGPTAPKVATADRCGTPGKGAVGPCGRPLGHPGAHMNPAGGPVWWPRSGA